MYGSSCPHVTNPNQFWVVGKSKASPNKLRTMGKTCNFINKKKNIYIYIYITETYEATTIFHVSKD